MKLILSKKYSGVYQYTKSNGDVSYYITYKDVNSKLCRVKVGDKSKGINEPYCFQKRNEIINNIRLGNYAPVIKHKKRNIYTLKKCFDEYLEWAKHNKGTWKADIGYLNNHLSSLENREVISLKSKDFEDLKQKKLLNGYSLASVKHFLGTASHAINRAIINERVKNYINPISQGKVKLSTGDNAKQGFLNQEQADILIERLKSKGGNNYYLTVLLLHTGARFSEVTSLTWQDVNFEKRYIFFKIVKGGNQRNVYITDLMLEILTQLKQEAQHDTLIIASVNNKKIQSMSKRWQLLVDKVVPGNKTAGKYRITTHSLRHTHASWMALSGADLLQIKEQLGHKNIKTTLRYAHLIPDKRYEVTKMIFD